MATWVKWWLGVACIVVLVMLHGPHREGDTASLVLGTGVLVWSVFGGAIMLRAFVRFIRQ
jgi:hypothetical protein